MAKTIYLIGGTMGVGKTTVCQSLKKKLEHSVFLDGDSCWDSHPFVVNDETKKMVMENICYLLNQYIHCSVYENIIFCWVMHEQSIIDEILSRIDTQGCDVKVISLVCDANTLKERLKKDVQKGIRNEDIFIRSLERLRLYEKVDSIKIDTSNKDVEKIINEMI